MSINIFDILKQTFWITKGNNKMAQYSAAHIENLIGRAMNHANYWEEMDDEYSYELFPVFERDDDDDSYDSSSSDDEDNNGDDEFDKIEDLFFQTMEPNDFEIVRVYRIQNPFQYGLYLEKLSRSKQIYKKAPREKLLFHGTLDEHVEGIARNNFDLNLVRRHKYGWGVSFSPYASYAYDFCDKNAEEQTMILATVMVTETVTANRGMTFEKLPRNCDTALSTDGNVVVKFEENSFYPSYVIDFQ